MLLFLGVLGWFARRADQEGAHRPPRADSGRRRRGAARAARKPTSLRPTSRRGSRRSRTTFARIHERAQAEGERQKRELIAAAEAEAQKILQSARNEVDNRLKRARHELTEYAGELATQRAEQILREKITDNDRERLFDESVREVAEARS